MNTRIYRNLWVLVLAFVVALLVFSWAVNAQTSNAAQDQKQDAKNATLNAIQDKAVVADQIRQDDAGVVRDRRIASVVKVQADAENRAQDVAIAVTGKQQLRNTDTIAITTARVEAVEEQSITDRQYMGFLSMVIGGMLLAQWLMQRSSAKRLENAATTLVERTEMLEAHITETTPAVIEAYKKNRE